MMLRLITLLICGLLTGGASSAETSPVSGELPAPKGLQPCSSDDPVAKIETGVAAKLGGEYLGCFRSERTMMLPGVVASAPTPVEYAFGLALQRPDYKLADLDSLLSTVKQQWKDFDPLSKEFKESYTARLNALIKSNSSEVSPSLVSIKPILVSIDRGSGNYYTVTSIRTYVIDLNGRRVTSTKVNSDAVALRGSQLIRLTIQRTMSDPSDVAQVQGEIANWAQATASSR